MTAKPSTRTLPLRRLLQQFQLAHLTDGQLLERFVAWKDEAAFECLVRRHGATVYGICRRVLGNEHDAEDAFQATFLVLARRAAAVNQRESVASWLFAIAHRLALRARTRLQRQRRREGIAAVAEQTPEPTSAEDRELQAVLDEEVTRLPEKYRAAVVLCCVEGRTRADAAAELGCSLSALKIRLERARKLLRGRLTRRGLGVPALLLWAWGGRAEGVPAAWLEAAARAGPAIAAGAPAAGLVSAEAYGLACGGSLMLSWMNVKLVGALLLVCSVSAGAALWGRADAQQSAGNDAPFVFVQIDDPDEEKASDANPVRLRFVQSATPAGAGALPGQTAAQPNVVQEVLGRGGEAGAAFSPDGKHLAVRSGDKVRLLDAATGKVVWETSIPAPKVASAGKIVAVPARIDATTGKVVANTWQAIDATTIATLKKLAESQDQEIRRLADELLKRYVKSPTASSTQQRIYLYEEPGSAPRTTPPVPPPPVPPLAPPASAAPVAPRSPTPPQPPATAAPPARTGEIEQRLDRLLQELQELRREVQSKKSPAAQQK